MKKQMQSIDTVCQKNHYQLGHHLNVTKPSCNWLTLLIVLFYQEHLVLYPFSQPVELFITKSSLTLTSQGCLSTIECYKKDIKKKSQPTGNTQSC